ncbi:MAG: GIY-YIG nuclease family protein [Desulfobacter sp.]|nr:MAG: GIY-YIG nuclease family protein [Desulfobacter sp.]
MQDLKKSNLYILMFPAKKVMKIGKANSLRIRISQLEKHWGPIDYNSSYSIAMETEKVFKLEKSLHFMVSEYSVAFDEGDGRTEFFSINAKEQVLEHIRLYLSTTGGQKALKKGIKESICKRNNSLKKHPVPQSKLFSEKSNRCINFLERNTANLKKVFFLIKLLLRYQSKIPFQYDVIEDNIYFRIKYHTSSQWDLIYSAIHHFNFHMEDCFGLVGWKVCVNMWSEDDIFQYQMDIKTDDVFLYRTYINTLIKNAIYKLPQKSGAVVENIPILDYERIFCTKHAA